MAKQIPFFLHLNDRFFSKKSLFGQSRIWKVLKIEGPHYLGQARIIALHQTTKEKAKITVFRAGEHLIRMDLLDSGKFAQTPITEIPPLPPEIA